MTNFFEVTLPALEEVIETLGLKRYRAQQVYKWVYQAGVQDFSRMTDLSKDVRQRLKEMFFFELPAIVETKDSTDGTQSKASICLKAEGVHCACPRR
jgi:23S rRNA (adenine2503-C2)-methyltransferase